MKLHTMNISGNLHEAARFLNLIGRAEFVLQLASISGTNSIAVLRGTDEQVALWRKEDGYVS